MVRRDSTTMADSGGKSELDGRTRVVFPEVLPLLPVRDLVVLPYMMAPLVVSRELSLAGVEAAIHGSRDKLVLMAAQRNDADEEPDPEQIHPYGCVGMIVKVRRLSDGRTKILVQGLQRVRLGDFVPGTPYLQARYTRLPDAPVPPEQALESEALMRAARESLERWTNSGKIISPELSFAIGAAEDPGRLADLIAACLGLPVAEAQPLAEELRPLERLRAVNARLVHELDVLAMRARIETRAREELSKGQREVFLREQLRAIRSELGDVDTRGELDELRGKLESRGLPDEALREARKQLARLEQLPAEAVEGGMLRAWLDWVAELPWHGASQDNLDLKNARAVLDEDHYDLRHVKDRILEYLAVLKLKGDRARGTILCLAGPPGVGKTSLGRSIARALGRRFVRISLGGVRDEGEIRGHRRTYVGAMPGRVLAGMKQAGTMNPVFMLDELDKLGHEHRGDPSAALLEVLDPEQNAAFRDHYLGLPYDLSRVLFLATCNHPGAIPAALRDRLEIIDLTGYSERQKLAIARRHLVPRQLEAAGLTSADLRFTGRALTAIIREYTRESGLRELERQIGRIARRRARHVAEHEGAARRAVTITARALEKRLGPPTYPSAQPGAPGSEEAVGVAVGLAWTPWGGEVLQVEAQSMPGKGTLLLTGQLGDVMRESAQAALSWARARAAQLGLPEGFFAEREIHLHVPAGAVPKDGPSAGATMAAALVSLLSGARVAAGVAMTGEISLRGHILPVGGLKEKLLAAARAPHIRTVLVPEANLGELAGLPRHLRERLRIIGVANVDALLAVAVPGALPGAGAQATATAPAAPRRAKG
jgi:ATP-dependent Lon protease